MSFDSIHETSYESLAATHRELCGLNAREQMWIADCMGHADDLVAEIVSRMKAAVVASISESELGRRIGVDVPGLRYKLGGMSRSELRAVCCRALELTTNLHDD
jgi:hypothetical protein